MKGREIGNLALHIGAGAAMAAAVWWHEAMIVLVVLIFAWLREQAQHRWILSQKEVGVHSVAEGLYHVEKQTFFGWMTWHRLWEVAQWGIGAGIVYGILEIVL